MSPEIYKKFRAICVNRVNRVKCTTTNTNPCCLLCVILWIAHESHDNISIALENVFFDVPLSSSERQPTLPRDARKPSQIGYALAGSGVVGDILLTCFLPIHPTALQQPPPVHDCLHLLAFVLMPIGNFAARLPPTRNYVWPSTNVLRHRAALHPVLSARCMPFPSIIRPWVDTLFGLYFSFCFLLSLTGLLLTMRVRDLPAPRSAQKTVRGCLLRSSGLHCFCFGGFFSQRHRRICR